MVDNNVTVIDFIMSTRYLMRDDDHYDAFIGLKKVEGEWRDIWNNPLGV